MGKTLKISLYCSFKMLEKINDLRMDPREKKESLVPKPMGLIFHRMSFKCVSDYEILYPSNYITVKIGKEIMARNQNLYSLSFQEGSSLASFTPPTKITWKFLSTCSVCVCVCVSLTSKAKWKMLCLASSVVSFDSRNFSRLMRAVPGDTCTH